MHHRYILPALLLFVCSAPVFASYFEGTFHNDRGRARATLDTPDGLYELDFQGVDLYSVGERFDRDRAVVEGSLSYSSHNRHAILVVNRITFRPDRNEVTYRIVREIPERRIWHNYPTRYERRQERRHERRQDRRHDRFW